MHTTFGKGLRRLAGGFLILGGLAVLCAAAALWADHTADAKSGGYPVLYDHYGRVIRDEYGRRFNYEPRDEPPPEPAVDDDRPNRSAEEDRQPSSLTVDVEWIWAVYGTYIGYTGLNPADLDGDGNLEVVAGANRNWQGNSFWYVLRHTAGDYPQVWARPAYASPIHSLRTYDLDGDGDDEVLVGVGSDIVVYDGLPPVEIRTIATGASEIRGLRVADVDGDGALELVFCDDSSLFIYDYASGALEEEVPGMGSYDVAVGQVDADGGLEIVAGGEFETNGWVLDGATRALEWELVGGFGRYTRTGDVDGDGRDEIVAGSGTLSVYDADTQSVAYTIPISDLDAVQVLDVEGDGPLEIVYGDGQWGEIHVVDGATGVEKWQKPNPDYGITDVAVADVDGDGTRELLWGAGQSSSGADYLFMADTVTRDIEWQSNHLDGPFYGLGYGDVDADGLNELVHTTFESENGYGDGMILIHGAASKTEEYRSGELYPWNYLGVRRVAHADVDGDPQEELFATTGSGYTPWIMAYDGLTHAQQWQIESGSIGALQVADVDGDGATEVVTAGVNVYVYDAATGGLEWQSASLGCTFYYYQYLRVANVDGDANPEIVTACNRGEVRIFDGVTHVEQLASGDDTSALETPDRDGDGVAEVLVGTTTGTIKVIDPASGATLETIGSYGARINGLAVIDLTLDEIPDYVFSTDDRLRIADGVDGSLIYSSDHIGDNVGRYDSLLAADIDADGNPEIVTNLGSVGILVHEIPVNALNPPQVTIDSPADGSTYLAGDAVSLAGTATDVEDGDLSSTILWSSHLDGPLGTGSALDTAALSIGSHWISAVVIDSDALQGSDQIRITIERTSLFTAGNIIVSIDDFDEVREYTKTGVLVRTIPVPPNGSETQRDLVLDAENDVLHIYNGTYNPVLSSLSFPSTWDENTFAGWSTITFNTYGGIATRAGYVFVTDMNTPGATAQGIVRFDTTAGYAATRFGEAYGYIDLAIGLDCWLYALRSSSGTTQTVDVFDPLTTDPLGSVALTLGSPSISLRGIAVSFTGEFFATADDGNIYHFDTGGNLVNSVAGGASSLADINLNADGDIVVSNTRGVVLLTTTALAGVSTVVDVGNVWETFVAFAGGELLSGCPSCFGRRELVADQWKMISLPCDVGTNDTVEEVFGDDLDPADYGDRWGIYRYSELNQIYRLLALTSPLKEGKGYWIKTIDSGQSINVWGELPSPVDWPLVADATDGAQNLVGHPFNFDVCWTDVQVVDGIDVLTLDEADPLVGGIRACNMVPPDPSCVVSRIGYKWNGAAYEAFDGKTMGMQGTLEPFNSLWVKAFKPGVELRIPPTPGADCTFCSPQPIADAGPDQTICVGDAVPIGTASQEGHTYSWSPGGETTAQITVSPAATTTYTLTTTTICGISQDSVVVTVVDGSDGDGFSDDFEGDVSGWTTTGLWHLVDDTTCWSPTPGYTSPTHAFYYGQDATCNFNVGITAGTLTSPPTTGIQANTELDFQYLRSAEINYYYDKCEVQIVHPGGTDTVLQITANASSWTPIAPISLADYVGQTIQVRFSFNSLDGSINTGKGWLIDDVSVGSGVTCPKGMTGGAVRGTRASAEASASQADEPRHWLVRLAVESGDLRDSNNVFGQLADARDGYDYHDLPEPPPFGERYLSIVFRHDDWNEYAGDYTSDFHAPDSLKGGWRFDVIAGGLSGPVTLRWAGEGTDLSGMFLIDEATGAQIRIEPFGSYTFAMESGRRSFRWIVGELFSDGFESGDTSGWSRAVN